VNLNRLQLHQAAMDALQTGNLGQAEVLLRRLLAEQPNDLEGLYSLARIGYISGRPDLVIEAMGRCIELDPKDGSSYHNLGNALRSKGLHDGAIAALRTAIQLMPNLADAHNTLLAQAADRADTAQKSGRRAPLSPCQIYA